MILPSRFAWAITSLGLCLAIAVPHVGAVDLIGYLPYYRMNATYLNNTLPGQLAMLDEVRYFGLTVNNSGSVVPLSGSGNMTTHLNNITAVRDIINALPESQRPRLDITMGGAGEAAAFSVVSASDSLRTTLAQNIDDLLDQTGATSVAIDWEHPSAGVERTTLYPALLSRIKQEVGSERRVYATVAPSVVINSVFSGPNAVDGVSLMTYDLGWWGNDPGNPNTGEHSLPEYAVDAVNAWTEAPGSPSDRPWVFGATWGNNAPEDRLGIGMPFYGRNISGNDAYTYSELYSGGTTSDGNYYSYSGQTVWTLDAELAAQRVQFAHDRGLQNVIFWELAQDLAPSHADSLLRAAFLMKQSLEAVIGDYNNNGIVDAADYTTWRDAFEAESTSLTNDPTPGVVDESDFTYWRDHFGDTAGGGGGAGAGQAVPEPSTLYALWVALCVLTVYSSRGRKPLR